MAKLKTRTNQPVTDSEGLLEHISQDGITTQIGGNLEVGWDLVVNNEAVIYSDVHVHGTLVNDDYISLSQALNLQGLNDGTYKTPYNKQQICNFLIRHRLSEIVFSYDDYLGIELKLTYLRRDDVILGETFAQLRGVVYHQDNLDVYGEVIVTFITNDALENYPSGVAVVLQEV